MKSLHQMQQFSYHFSSSELKELNLYLNSSLKEHYFQQMLYNDLNFAIWYWNLRNFRICFFFDILNIFVFATSFGISLAKIQNRLINYDFMIEHTWSLIKIGILLPFIWIKRWMLIKHVYVWLIIYNLMLKSYLSM